MRFLLLLVIVGCGDPLVEAGYRGDPLLSFEGLITDLRFNQRIERLSLSIFWGDLYSDTTDPNQLVEQSGIDVRTGFPTAFAINVFNLPNEEVLASAVEPVAGASILVYDDEDGDGRMSPGELRGGAPGSAVLYALDDLRADASPTNEDLAAGYHVVRTPLPCGLMLPTPERGDEDCGANLGAPCKRDTECTGPGAVCRTELAGGYCTIPVTDGGCRPRNGVREVSFASQTSTSAETPSSAEDWYKACAGDEECRAEDGQTCPHWLGACYPQGPVRIELSRSFFRNTVCNELIDL